MGERVNRNTLIVLAITLLLLGCATDAGKVIYVDADASTGGDGTTWQTAYKYLQDALDGAVTDDEVWVAAGTYVPTAKIGGSSEKHKSFQLKKGVAIYGGFAGAETSREQRDWQENKTILGGDLKGDDTGFSNNSENCYHVVIGNNTDSTAVLDGFIISGGNANAESWPDDGGGGMSNFEGSPTIKNCTFRGNAAYADGAGMRNWGNCSPLISNSLFIENKVIQEGGGMMNGPGSSPTVTNCTFINNAAGEDGGGMYNNESNPLVTNCVFNVNLADLTGGGMYNVNGSSPAVTNCTFSGNTAVNAGGAMCNVGSNPTLINCILWDNSAPADPEINNSESSAFVSYSDIKGAYSGPGNIDRDPMFADKDLRLSVGSPCIDAGDNKAITVDITNDLDAQPRIFNGDVDMGAYEFSKKEGDKL
jgi:hypothetical protein